MFSPGDETTPGYYGPNQTALLLLDFHSLFIDKAGPGGAGALATACKLRTWAKSKGIVVIHALVDVNQLPYPTCKDAARLASIIDSMKSSGADKVPVELLQGGGDITFTRQPGFTSALKSPGLKEFLQEKGIKSLVLAGLSTSGCVCRTSLMACDEEFVVTVISDACADPAEGVHDLMVSKILNNRGYATTAAEFQAGYTKVFGD